MLNDAKEPLYVMGGKNKPYGHFHYTLADDGTISIQLDTDPTNHIWTMKYQNGKIIAPIKPDVVNPQAEARSVTRGEVSNDIAVVELTSATEEEQTHMQTMDAQLFQPTKVTFSLKDTNGKAIKAKELTISINGGHYSMKNSTASSEFSVNLSPVENRTLILSAISDNDTYVTTKKNVSFEKGKATDMEVNLMKVETVQLWKNGPKFANMNLGATSANDYGLYYSWCTTTDFRQLNRTYSWRNLPYFIDKNNTVYFSKYFQADGALLEASDDAAAMNWGGTWRIPTFTELRKLADPDVCSSEWKIIDGIPGRVIKGATKGYKDNSIFLPAGDYILYDILITNQTLDGAIGKYWSASAYGESAYLLYFGSSTTPFVELDKRYMGFVIRPVK